MFNRLLLVLIVSFVFTVSVFAQPFAYVSNIGTDNMFVIDTATNMIVGSPIMVGDGPDGTVVTPDCTRVYVANIHSDDVSVIDTRTNTVMTTIPAGEIPDGV